MVSGLETFKRWFEGFRPATSSSAELRDLKLAVGADEMTEIIRSVFL